MVLSTVITVLRLITLKLAIISIFYANHIKAWSPDGFPSSPGLHLQTADSAPMQPPHPAESAADLAAVQANFFSQLVQVNSRLRNDLFLQDSLNASLLQSFDNRLPLHRPLLDPSRVQELRFYASLTAAAYCRRQSIFPKWNCGYPRCSDDGDLLRQMRVYRYLSNDGVAGYIATNPMTPGRIFVVYRGSLTMNNFVNDLLFAQADYSFPEVPPLAKIHEGFFRTWLSVKDQTISAIHEIISILDGINVEITLSGHSLGGVCAVLAGLELRRRLHAGRYPFIASRHHPPGSVRFRLYTFGEPRIGNEIFAQWLASLSDELPIFRTTYFNDLIPRLPPRKIVGGVVLPHLSFHHHSAEYHILQNQSITIICRDRDSHQKFPDSRFDEDPMCSSGVGSYNIFAHLTYYNIVYGPWC